MLTHPKPVDEHEVRGVTPGALDFTEQWRTTPKIRLLTEKAAGYQAQVCLAPRELWLVLTWPSGAKLAMRCASFFGPATIADQSVNGCKCFFILDSAVGRYEVRIDLDSAARFVHWTSRLRPREYLRFRDWPPDLYPVGPDSDPLGSRGIVHTKQEGTRAAFLFGSMTRPAGGSWLYLQNLTALSPYFEKTGSSPAHRIVSEWPELGFSLPGSDSKTLQKGEEIVISDGYLIPSEKVPVTTENSAELFLELYSRMYLKVPRPDAEHRDWPRRVDETISHLTTSPGCMVFCGEHRYVRAYVAQDDCPPESMVQLALLLPLLEYSISRGKNIPLIRELESNIPTFFNRKVGSVVRWLPGHGKWFKAREEHEGENIMDSWYLYHTYLNLARLAAHGNGAARGLFLESLEYGTKVARHFGYNWPVLFDIYTLAVVRGEKAPGKGGEADVGAQYVHVMQQAWEMTGDEKYVHEAEQAAQRLEGIGFELGYQYNNTSFGAGALMWLWKKTGKDLYRKLSTVCLASMAQNFWLWECEYGYARHYHTFMGMPPLRDAPYLALYEELEILAACHEYLRIAGEDALGSMRILLPEYCKFLLGRAWYHYPSDLPRDILAEKCKSGRLERHLSIPLEDLYDGWSKAGKVGQQVYGAAAPFVFATRHFHQVPGNGFVIGCDYPLREMQMEGGPEGCARFQAEGDRRCSCHLRITTEKFDPLPAVKVFVGKNRRLIKGELKGFGYLEFKVPGNARITLEWKPARKRGSRARIGSHRSSHHRNGELRRSASIRWHSAQPNQQPKRRRYDTCENGSKTGLRT